MTLSNGSVILKADLDVAVTDQISRVRTENRRTAGAYQVTVDFVGLLSATAAGLRVQKLVLPDDSELIEMGARVVCSTTPKIYTLAITGPLVETISLSESASSSPFNLTRYGATAGRPLQAFLRGAEYSLTASTDAASGTSILRAFLLFRTRPRRY